MANSQRLSPTEQRNPRSLRLDELSSRRAVALMIDEETSIGPALQAVAPRIERALNLIVKQFHAGGRLFYVGAGTSGRVGLLDALECPPTFHLPPGQIQAIVAGGLPALSNPDETAEDDPQAGAHAIVERKIRSKDVVMGIAASGRTPFVWGAIGEAKKRRARTILLCFNPYVEIPKGLRPDVVIAANVGPELLTGSTRLKAGTATKIILNTLTTLAMARLGKVRSNLMVDLDPANKKLRERAVRIVQALTRADAEAARTELERCRWRIKTALKALE